MTLDVSKIVEAMKDMNASYTRIGVDGIDIFIVTDKDGADHIADSWDEYCEE